MYVNNNGLNKDALIILARTMDSDGTLHLESKLRIHKAIEIFKNRYINYIVTAGWAYRQDSSLCIADAYKEYIVSKFNIEKNTILTESNSRDTVGDAFFTKINFSEPMAWNKITVVTSNYHVERAREIFEFIYGDSFILEVYGAEVVHDETTIANEVSSLNSFRRTFQGIEKANNSQILDCLRESHPFYNGKIFPKI